MTMPASRPLRAITAVAPIRICDIGGWTDTWFARRGRVVNIAVSPLVEVRVEAFRRDAGTARVTILTPVEPGEGTARPAAPGTHPLLEAAVETMSLPDDLAVVIEVRSDVPPGAGTGTSAAVTVALIGALDALATSQLTPEGIARAAHDVEVCRLGRECGIQDQLASALGGISAIEITSYPRAHRAPIDVPAQAATALAQQLALIYLGRGHDSSSLHERVIRKLEHAGPECRELEDLRDCAARAATALRDGDLPGLGRAMIDNTAAQARLHPDLVSADARVVIDIARAHGALGWKVNGAGGDGGSITLLAGPSPLARQAMLEALARANPLLREIPVRLSAAGVRRWESVLPPGA